MERPTRFSRITKIFDVAGRQRWANHGWAPLTEIRCRFDAAKLVLRSLESRIYEPPDLAAFRATVAKLGRYVLNFRRWEREKYLAPTSKLPQRQRIPAAGRTIRASVGLADRRHRVK
jgi:hypothetical protein